MRFIFNFYKRDSFIEYDDELMIYCYAIIFCEFKSNKISLKIGEKDENALPGR